MEVGEPAQVGDHEVFRLTVHIVSRFNLIAFT